MGLPLLLLFRPRICHNSSVFYIRIFRLAKYVRNMYGVCKTNRKFALSAHHSQPRSFLGQLTAHMA